MTAGRVSLFIVIASLAMPAAVRGATEPDVLLDAIGSVHVVAPDTVAGAPDVLDTVVADVVAIGVQAVTLFGAPLRFTLRDWGTVGAGAAVFGASFALDEPGRRVALRNQSQSGNDVALATNAYGTPVAAAVVGGGTWLTGLAFDLPGVRVAGRHVAQAVLYSGLVTTLAKWVIGRERPYAGEGPFVFVGPQSDDRYYSLPSGHTTVAFAISSSLAADIDHPVATVLLYAAATATAIGRVYTDRHWASDITLGAMIGTACGWGTANLDNGAPTDDGGSSWMLVPTTNGLAVVGVW